MYNKASSLVPKRASWRVAFALLVCGAAPVWAETVVVESRTGGKNFAAYAEGTGNWQNSTAKSSAADVTAGIGSRFETVDGTPSFTVTPTLVDGATYSVEVTHGVSTSIPLDLVVGISQVGCTGLPATTTAFNQAPANVWRSVGTITVNAGVTTPTITFTKQTGTPAAGRFYSDAVRFINLADPCLSGLSQLTTVNGPLGAGQTFVDVPSVSAAATRVTVYADGVQIGQKTSGVAAGVNRVTTSPLAKGKVITVTQTDAALVESCRPSTGPLIGGGSNPRIRISLNIKQAASATALNGPIGADGGTAAGPLKFLGATNTFAGGFGNAPVGGKVFQPSANWQTVSFQRGADPLNPVDRSYAWANSDGANEIKYDFGILDAVAFAIDDLTDTGPFVLYIDNLMNGDVKIQGFESAAIGANSVTFNQPSFSGSTSPFLLSQPPGSISPNISRVSNDTADQSGNSLQVSWQFKDTSGGDWVRLVGQGSGTPNPQVDLRLPISFRMLLLPVGASIPQTAPIIGAQPVDQSVLQGGSVTLTVGAHALPQPLSYQWRFNGGIITDATNRSLTLSSVQQSAAGQYSVDVSNSLGTTPSSNAVVTVIPVIQSNVLTPLWSLPPGSRSYLTNDGSQRSIAYNPLTGNLLMVSRTGGSNAIYVLNSDTGAFLRTMNTDPSIITGGTLSLNMVGVAEDGTVYAANQTADGTVNEFRVYQWLDDGQATVPTLAWQGDPGAGFGTGSGGAHRWGDTMAVRGTFDFPTILVGSGAGTVVCYIQPAFGSTSQSTIFDVAGASPGDFGLGLAFGDGSVIWGKNINGPIRQAQLDEGLLTGTVLKSFAVHPDMGPIGVNPANKLLAGISIETPDNLRLLDLSNLGGGLFDLDTEFFPTDNPNPNHTGAVTFGPGRVYALDSNNGLIALTLDLACAPIGLTLTPSGSDVVLSWGRTGYRLQGSATLGASAMWNDIPGGSPATVPTSGDARFFRLICP